MVVKTPVITTQVGGVVDSVKHEETGLLVNKRSPDEIAKAIERLAKEPMLADRFRNSGYKIAVTKFYRRSSAIAFSQLCEKVVQMKKQA